MVKPRVGRMFQLPGRKDLLAAQGRKDLLTAQGRKDLPIPWESHRFRVKVGH